MANSIPNSTLSPRQIAGRLNRLKRKELTAAGRERLRQAALRDRPWVFSTGPKTAAGKARSAANGKSRQTRELSGREAAAGLAEVTDLVHSLAELRRRISRATK